MDRSRLARFGVIASLILLSLLRAPEARGQASRVRFHRAGQPLLADHCFACHGPDRSRRRGDLRLDQRADGVRAAIVPGNARASLLLARVSSTDPHEVMPPPHPNRVRLSAAQVELLRRWIDEGAEYEPHWSFIRPERPPTPAVNRSGWGRNPIDAFLAAEHAKHGLAPTRSAGPAVLLRRLHLTLTGLPPTPDEVAAFVRDRSAGAYEKAVDRLLASPHFGERMAVFWLDLVRYADTDGYSMDNHRDVWMYRDYVIDAFNRNLAFDRFTTQQLAGDLLPHQPGRALARREHLAASGYNRLLMTSAEGCADPREYVVRYAADRVKNLSAAWLGVTLGCAECHDHKFDPFTARDFYRLAAFFADIQEKGVGRQDTTRLALPQQMARLDRLNGALTKRRAALSRRMADLHRRKASDPAKHRSRLMPAAQIAGLLLLFSGAAFTLRGGAAGRSRLALLSVSASLVLLLPLFHLRGGIRDDTLRALAHRLHADQKVSERIEAERNAVLAASPPSLISLSGPRREVRVLPRGDWTNTTGEVVQSGLPVCLSPSSDGSNRGTRLDLARWLTAAENPLVSRVFVNRLWRIAFGEGLVRNGDDFGARGAAPTHPELLDWLAVEFVERGWDVKALVRLLVTSAAFRQASQADQHSLHRDPDNRWLARQNRFRLDAEFVRDSALSVSGLLWPRVGGPSVKPYQPEGFWAARFNEKQYKTSAGEDQYRRGVYTYWCRTYPHPSLQAFDAPSRQLCTAERGRSSTPAQALVLLNDPTYAEAARALALRILKDGGPSVSPRIQFAYRLVLARDVRPAEAAILRKLYVKHLREFATDRLSAAKLLRVGAAPVPADVSPAELAAWTSVARALLNLQETTTRN